MSDEREHTPMLCTRCGTPATRTDVQAIDEHDTCPSCGAARWERADSVPSVKYQLSASDREWLRSIRIGVDETSSR